MFKAILKSQVRIGIFDFWSYGSFGLTWLSAMLYIKVQDIIKCEY